MQMTAHGLHVFSGCNSRLHVRQIGVFDSIISSSSEFHAEGRLASRPVRHAIDWNHRGVPPGRKPLPCLCCCSSHAAAWMGRVPIPQSRKTRADYRAKPNVSPMAFRRSTPLRWSKPTHYPRARSATTKADHAPPATTNGLGIPISLADRSSGRPAAGDGREPFCHAPAQPGRALQVRKTISGT